MRQLAGRAVRHAQARRRPPGRLRARRRPFPADRALPSPTQHIRDVVLTTEEEGVAMAAGAWLGGQRCALLMQSSGVGNCINMLSLSRICRFPMLMFITMRGEWEEFNPWQVPMGSIVEPVLKQCEAEVYRARKPDEVPGIAERAVQQAYRRRAHRRGAAVAGTDRQEGVDQMSLVGSTAAKPWPRWSPTAATICWWCRGSARPPMISRPPATTTAISISGAPWAAPP